MLSQNDKLILDRLQNGIPAISRPFAQIAKELEIHEKFLIEKIKELVNNNIIRWLGAIFSTNALGYKSTLAAFKISPANIEEAAAILNRHPGITHNYQRTFEYNLWFTIALSGEKELNNELKKLAEMTGASKWLNLPALKTYKIGLILPLSMESFKKSIPQSEPKDNIACSLSSDEKKIVRLLQEMWPIIPEPFKLFSSRLDMGEGLLINKINKWIERGIIRRIAPIVKHKNAGFKINWMVAWQVAENSIDIAGEAASLNIFVSHCYRRKANPEFPYELFTMIHARDVEEAEENVKKLSNIIKPIDFKILPTVEEFKKTRLKLFCE